MSEGTPKRGPTGIVIAHGDMAGGLVSAVRRISGSRADVLVPLSNEGKSPEEMRARIAEVADGGSAVVFVDLQAGSCCTAALASCSQCADRAVVTGVNLPMLLDFVFHQETPFGELVERLVEQGRSAIKPVHVDVPGAV